MYNFEVEEGISNPFFSYNSETGFLLRKKKLITLSKVLFKIEVKSIFYLSKLAKMQWSTLNDTKPSKYINVKIL